MLRWVLGAGGGVEYGPKEASDDSADLFVQVSEGVDTIFAFHFEVGLDAAVIGNIWMQCRRVAGGLKTIDAVSDPPGVGVTPLLVPASALANRFSLLTKKRAKRAMRNVEKVNVDEVLRP